MCSSCTDNLHKVKQLASYNVIEEYINRVGKRLLIVADNPTLATTDIKFKLDLNKNCFIKVNTEQQIIIITRGMLEQLQDEAELAAILAMALTDLAKIPIEDCDEKIIKHLYRAGYDPMAFVELEEEFLTNKHKEVNWLESVFSIGITNYKINFNKKLATSLSKGMQRAKQHYFINIRLLETLD